MSTTTDNATQVATCPYCGHQHEPAYEGADYIEVKYWAEGMPIMEEDEDGNEVETYDFYEGDSFEGEARILSDNRLRLTRTTHDDDTHYVDVTSFEIECPNCGDWHYPSLIHPVQAALLDLGFDRHEVGL